MKILFEAKSKHDKVIFDSNENLPKQVKEQFTKISSFPIGDNAKYSPYYSSIYLPNGKQGLFAEGEKFLVTSISGFTKSPFYQDSTSTYHISLAFYEKVEHYGYLSHRHFSYHWRDTVHIYYTSVYNAEAINVACTYANNLVKQLISVINDEIRFSKVLHSYADSLSNKLRKSYKLD